MRVLLLFLPYPLILSILLLRHGPGEKPFTFRDLLLIALVLWSTLLWAVCEGLSPFHWLERRTLTFCWGILNLGLILLLLHTWKHGKRTHLRGWLAPLKSLGGDSKGEWAALLLLAGMIVCLGWVASVYPPNNNDSMTYPLARVMHWQQNRSLAPYATPIERQILMPPFTEEIFLQLTELTGSSQADNYVQFGAYLVCLVGGSLLTYRLGGRKIAQIATALICAGIPITVLQATSTQNDLTAAAWLIIFVNFGILLVKTPSFRFAMLTGLGLGLAILTKTTSYIFALPFCIAFGLDLLQHQKWRGAGNDLFQALRQTG